LSPPNGHARKWPAPPFPLSRSPPARFQTAPPPPPWPKGPNPKSLPRHVPATALPAPCPLPQADFAGVTTPEGIAAQAPLFFPSTVAVPPRPPRGGPGPGAALFPHPPNAFAPPSKKNPPKGPPATHPPPYFCVSSRAPPLLFFSPAHPPETTPARPGQSPPRARPKTKISCLTLSRPLKRGPFFFFAPKAG